MGRQNVRRRILLLVTLSCILFLTVLLFSGMAVAEGEKPATVMLYMCGSDLEGENNLATKTMRQINQLHIPTDRINVVAVLGGAYSWAGGYDPSVLTLVELGGRRPVKIDTMPLSSMGEPATLTHFLDYCYQNYPAEKYYLVVWDHGGGPNNGVCFDDLFDHDSLLVGELRDALSQSYFGSGRKLDLIAFHTCLTGSLEIAANIAPYANYFVASEDSMFGLSFDWVAAVGDGEDTLKTAVRIVDGTYEFNKQAYEANHASEINSVVAVDLSAIHEVVEYTDAFFREMNTDDYLWLSEQRRNSVSFGVTESNGSSNYDLVDLGDLVFHLRSCAPEAADRLIVALGRAVVYKRSATEACSGLTVYHPYSNKDYLRIMMAIHNDILFPESYSNYIQRYASFMTGTPLAEWTNLSIRMIARKDNRTLLSLILSDSQEENLAASRMIALEKTGEDAWRFTFDQPSVKLKGNTLEGEFVAATLRVVSGDEVLSHPLIYEMIGDGVYQIPVTLTRLSQNGEEALTALLRCSQMSDGTGLKVDSILILDKKTGGYTAQNGYKLEDFSAVSFPDITRRKTCYADGALKPFEEWDIVEEKAWTAPIDGSWSLGRVKDSIDPAKLYASFLLTDAQYNRYCSNLYPIRQEKGTAGEIRVEYDDLESVHIDNFNIVLENGKLTLSLELKNLTDHEVIIVLKKLAINDLPAEGEAEALGKGENWGLLNQETQSMSLSLPSDKLPVSDTISELSFDLVLTDAATNEPINTVPVKVHMLLDLLGQ